MIDKPRLVVDISLYDDHIDAKLLKKAGVAAVIVRSGSGMQRDPKFVSNAQAVADAGLILMAYYWDDILCDPTNQAMWAVEDIARTGLPVKFIWADQEQWWTSWSAWHSARKGEIPYSAVPRASAANISLHNRIFAGALHALYPQSGVYSNYGFVTSWAQPIKDWLGLFPLWVAHFGRQPRPPISTTWETLQKEWMPNYPLLIPPGGKEEWIFGHQFTGDAFRLPGIYDAANKPMLTDVSIFEEEFLKVISAGQVPPPPPENPDPSVPPEGAPEYFVNVGVLNVRSGPGTSYKIVGWLNRNTVVKIDKIQDQWAHLEGGTSWAWGPYLTAVGPVVTPTPVDPPEDEDGLDEYYVNVPAVNVRNGPGTANDIIGKLYKNARVFVREIQGDWAHLDNQSWVFAAYLTRVI
jgi:uncharacterized protein YraI